MRYVLALAVLLVLATAGVSAAAPRVVVDPGVESAVAMGPARVIVQLRVPAGATGDEARRQAVAAAGDVVLDRLRGTDYKVIRRYDNFPMLALEIGHAALTALRGMGDVVARVDADRLSFPSRM